MQMVKIRSRVVESDEPAPTIRAPIMGVGQGSEPEVEAEHEDIL